MADYLGREETGSVRARIGPCMEPLIPAGTVVEFFPVARVVPGMIVLVAGRRGHVIHRILQVVPPWAVHAGDAVPNVGICRLREILGVRVGSGTENSMRGLPGMRPARMLRLLLALALPFHDLGLPAHGSVRAGMKILKRLAMC